MLGYAKWLEGHLNHSQSSGKNNIITISYYDSGLLNTTEPKAEVERIRSPP